MNPLVDELLQRAPKQIEGISKDQEITITPTTYSTVVELCPCGG